ncbi:MAG: hypothetical protein QXL09_03140 [Candidatus Aenigmatarchaeota archaeon]
MRELIDIESIKRSVKYFSDKVITSLNLLKNELEKKEIDFPLIQDYLWEAQGYLTVVHRELPILRKIMKNAKRMVKDMPLSDKITKLEKIKG